jgi:hypothetical protein
VLNKVVFSSDLVAKSLLSSIDSAWRGLRSESQQQNLMEGTGGGGGGGGKNPNISRDTEQAAEFWRHLLRSATALLPLRLQTTAAARAPETKIIY